MNVRRLVFHPGTLPVYQCSKFLL